VGSEEFLNVGYDLDVFLHSVLPLSPNRKIALAHPCRRSYIQGT